MSERMSRLSIDYRNVMVSSVGQDHGLTDRLLESTRDALADAGQTIWREQAVGEQRWLNLPDDVALADEIEAFAAGARGRFDDFILIGIGGSSLGAIATIQALTHPQRNLLPAQKRRGPRFFVLDNPDPERVAAILETVDLARTLINVVTKSGQTAETMANFLVAEAALVAAVGPGRARQQIVATTDPAEGLLRKLAEELGYRTFPVPPGVDGRMTVLSAVGMLPAAMCGVDIHGLLAGARAGRRRCQLEDPLQIPGSLLAAIAWLCETQRKKSMMVTMPYADALYGMSDWFRQLWAESLGKRLSISGEEVFAGQTPIRALGAIDQHSQIQLYTEGPNDKLHSIIAVDAYRATATIAATPAGISELSYLQGAELGELLNRERQATAWALTNAQRPNLTISAPVIDAGVIGELFLMYEWQTMVAGALYGVNPSGQSGVEAGKNATYALMGRQGYEALQAELTAETATSPHILPA